MPYISSDIMPIIVEFLDMKDRAKMAMVNKAWNRCMYRSSIWKNNVWTPAHATVGAVVQLSLEARHIGTPCKTCFFHWLDNQRSVRAVSVKKCYQHWKKIGSPCLYIHHHYFEDTVIASKQYKALSEKDKQYFFYRCTIPKPSRENAYSAYLRSLIEEFQHIRMNLDRSILPPIIKSADVYNDLYTASMQTICKHNDDVYKYVKEYEYMLKSCNEALVKRGHHQWILNEAAFIKDPVKIWDSVAFSL
jgi:hypothetical protein